MACGVCPDPALCREGGGCYWEAEEEARWYQAQQQRAMEEEQYAEHMADVERAHYRDLYGGCLNHPPGDPTCEDCIGDWRHMGLLI